MQYTINKKLNDYVGAIPRELFEDTPKAVWAAIAISFAVNLGAEGNFDEAAQAVIREWGFLHLNGLVPQPVPARLRKYDNRDGDDYAEPPTVGYEVI